MINSVMVVYVDPLGHSTSIPAAFLCPLQTQSGIIDAGSGKHRAQPGHREGGLRGGQIFQKSLNDGLLLKSGSYFNLMCIPHCRDFVRGFRLLGCWELGLGEITGDFDLTQRVHVPE